MQRIVISLSFFGLQALGLSAVCVRPACASSRPYRGDESYRAFLLLTEEREKEREGERRREERGGERDRRRERREGERIERREGEREEKEGRGVEKKVLRTFQRGGRFLSSGMRGNQSPLVKYCFI